MTLTPTAAELPDGTLTASEPFGLYIHVPFCFSRCGYCDFNTYTPAELGGVNPDAWVAGLAVELELAAARLDAPAPQTVFVGGGTPSLLGGERLTTVLDAVRRTFGLADGAEVTTEANPESTSPEFFDAIRAAGYNRVSLGMQSASWRVLATLDRIHSPGRPVVAAAEARAAGFTHLNIDLIYGTPGEADEDLAISLDAALEAGADHVSAYGLIVEEGTALARRVRRGEIPAPDDDVLAHRYEMVDARLTAAGFDWYEVSNWARPGGQCRHNLGYWGTGQWWGAGPGAHGYISDRAGGLRLWNVKHPNAYAQLLGERVLPVAAFERLDAVAIHTEQVLLRLRTRRGLPLDLLNVAERARADTAIADGLAGLERQGSAGHLVLTDRGRLLADAVVRKILD